MFKNITNLFKSKEKKNLSSEKFSSVNNILNREEYESPELIEESRSAEQSNIVSTLFDIDKTSSEDSNDSLDKETKSPVEELTKSPVEEDSKDYLQEESIRDEEINPYIVPLESNKKETLQIVNYDSKYEDIPYFNDLIEKYINKPWKHLKNENAQGAANFIYKYENTENGTVRVVRLAINPSFIIKKDFGNKNKIILLNPNGGTLNEYDSLHDRIIKQIEQSKQNWTIASDLNLSPELYFWGFVKRKMGRTEFLFECNIGESYEMDLEKYYKQGPGNLISQQSPNQLTEIDLDIQNQLTRILDSISMSPLQVICFDIKPANCVINTKPNLEVKLIDWDGDWCKRFDKLKIPITASLTSIIHNMVMANHFYTWINRNIFSNYFNNMKKFMEENKETLRILYCNAYDHDKIEIIDENTGVKVLVNGEAPDDGIKYTFFTKHYFFNPELVPNDEIPDTCSDMFDIIFDRCFKINNIQSKLKPMSGGSKTLKYKKQNNKMFKKTIKKMSKNKISKNKLTKKKIFKNQISKNKVAKKKFTKKKIFKNLISKNKIAKKN